MYLFPRLLRPRSKPAAVRCSRVLSGLSFQLRSSESEFLARLDFHQAERAGAASCLIESAAQKLEFSANSRRDGVRPPCVFEETIDGCDTYGRVKPLWVEVTVFEVHVPKVCQRPLRSLRLGRGVCPESSDGFHTSPQCQHCEPRIAFGLHNCPTYRPVCDAPFPIANDHVELIPINHRSTDLSMLDARRHGSG